METVRFYSRVEGQRPTMCTAGVSIDVRVLNMGTCLINLPKSSVLIVTDLGDFARVSVSDGLFWFDTDLVEAYAIKDLFDHAEA